MGDSVVACNFGLPAIRREQRDWMCPLRPVFRVMNGRVCVPFCPFCHEAKLRARVLARRFASRRFAAPREMMRTTPGAHSLVLVPDSTPLKRRSLRGFVLSESAPRGRARFPRVLTDAPAKCAPWLGRNGERCGPWTTKHSRPIHPSLRLTQHWEFDIHELPRPEVVSRSRVVGVHSSRAWFDSLVRASHATDPVPYPYRSGSGPATFDAHFRSK